jgi:hypothetical protein
VSSYFRNIKPKQTPSAVRQRVRLLTNDKAAERQAETQKANNDRARMTRIRGAAQTRSKIQGKPAGRFSDGFLARVRHHLARGRGAADIVIRENVLMSVVEAAVAQVRKEVVA